LNFELPTLNLGIVESEDLDFERDHPEVNLLETSPEPLFEVTKELAVFVAWFHVHDQAQVFVFKAILAIDPDSPQRFW
jgi:hypothetical protein